MIEKECDVVVVGLGGAGASAAVTAHDAGAKVIVIEKHSEGGGNTKYAGGSVRTFRDKVKAIEHYYLLAEGTTDKKVFAAFVDEATNSPDWLRNQGVDLAPRSAEERGRQVPRTFDGSAYPAVPGAEGIGTKLYVGLKGKLGAGGSNLWGVLAKAVASRNIEVLTSHRAQRLLTDRKGEVAGVEADGPDGKIRIKAKRAVVLSCGGFENNQEMHMNYLGAPCYPMGTEQNTGDGIMMALEVGADLWHMNASAMTFGYRAPGVPTAFKAQSGSFGVVYVDQHGRRFMDETGVDTHAMWSQVQHIDIKIAAKPRIPSYFIFDDDTRRAGPIAESEGRCRACDFYQWSPDNMAEVDKGWIVAGESTAELAAKLKVDSKNLQQTIYNYNMACVGGYDPEFERASHTLVPLVRPPFYAIALWPAFMNTQGGPRRNARAQVIDVRGKPIKRLYSAGELGSIFGRFYPGGGNVSEALAFGRIAGRNAAAESER